MRLLRPSELFTAANRANGRDVHKTQLREEAISLSTFRRLEPVLEESNGFTQSQSRLTGTLAHGKGALELPNRIE